MDIAIDVRVAVDKFVAHAISNIGIVERTSLVAHLRVEDYVKQQIAKLLLDALHIFVGDSIHQLIGLLNSIIT